MMPVLSTLIPGGLRRPTSFHSLSREVRYMIYKLSIVTGETFTDFKPPPITQVSRAIREEAGVYYFSRNAFRLDYDQHSEETDEYKIYYGDILGMCETFAYYIPFIKHLTIYGQEDAYNVDSCLGWLHTRDINYRYRLTLLPKDELKAIAKLPMPDEFDDESGNTGRGVVDDSKIDWSDEDSVFVAFSDAVSSAYGDQNYLRAEVTTRELPRLAIALLDIGPLFNSQDYGFLFWHDSQWPPSDHEIDLIEAEEEERRAWEEEDEEDEDPEDENGYADDENDYADDENDYADDDLDDAENEGVEDEDFEIEDPELETPEIEDETRDENEEDNKGKRPVNTFIIPDSDSDSGSDSDIESKIALGKTPFTTRARLGH
ncbi:hypothetical protein GGR52DRAFT_485550 [Hypoxylon sp. FL1284]|nr:hypothetical protein GGR52DRAFT_485550 [Hypoxylon sp. FL1284]